MPRTPDFTVVVLISGRGSNCQSLISHARNYRVIGVLSNTVDAPGLSYARDAGIEAVGFARREAGSLAEHKRQIYAGVEALRPDLIVLAGFMQILEQSFVERNHRTIVNIHPSILPKFKGLNTHRRVLQAYREGDTPEIEHGCSVHYVDYAVDSGPIIAQAVCPIRESDTEERLAARVLQLEHKLFPWVVNAIAADDIGYRADAVVFSPKAAAEAAEYNFFLPGRGAVRTGSRTT